MALGGLIRDFCNFSLEDVYSKSTHDWKNQPFDRFALYLFATATGLDNVQVKKNAYAMQHLFQAATRSIDDY